MILDVQKVSLLRDPLYHGYYGFTERTMTGKKVNVPAEDVLCEMIYKIIEKEREENK